MRISFWALLGSYIYFPFEAKTTFKEGGGGWEDYKHIHEGSELNDIQAHKPGCILCTNVKDLWRGFPTRSIHTLSEGIRVYRDWYNIFLA